ncbi:MAG: ribonuclease E activity regulator RraA [Pseudomonadota bacterium]
MSVISTCDICDEYPDLVRPLPPIFSDFGAVTAFHGPVRTVKCFEDNSKVKAVLATPGSGAVLMVDGGGSLRRSLVGGNVAASAAANGWSGIIVYGAVRDRLELEVTEVGLKAMALIPVKTDKKDVGDIDIAIEIEHVAIAPGQYVYADQDGIIICPEALHEAA